LHGTERISQLFDFQLLLVCDTGNTIDVEGAVGQHASLVFELRPGGRDNADGAQELRRIHGIMTEIDEIFEGNRPSYRLRIQPTLAICSLVETLDIFMDLDIAGIVRSKLSLFGLEEGNDFEFRFIDTYPVREFVVQYKESDLAFLSRQSEHWGISFFFEHRDGRDVLVFCDRNESFLDSNDHLAFCGRGDEHGVHALRNKTKLVPRTFVQRDYNYRKPGVDVTGLTEAGVGAGGLVEYGGHFKTNEEAARMANLRREEVHANRRVYEGTSSLPSLGAGQRFELSEYPPGDLSLLAIEVEHNLRQPVFSEDAVYEPYQCTFKAIHTNVPFRPPRITPKPRVPGVLTGIIESASGGEYADLDDDGRYRVKFLFDTNSKDEAKASRPVRMMQPHSGPGYGMHFPLRSGVEVLITFMDGDPDRPIIAGTVPNPLTASPVTAGNANRNVIRTGGGNEINIDDTEGSTRIKMSVPEANTIFQLGAPNGPERGALLTSTGASTTIAATGSSNVTTFNGTLSAILQFGSAGSISSVAEKPGKWALFLAGIGLVNALAAEAASVLKMVKDFRAQKLADKKAASMRADAEKDKANDNLAEAESDQKAKHTALTASCQTTAEKAKLATLDAAKTAYDTAVKDYSTKYGELVTLESDRGAADSKGLTHTVAQKDAEIGTNHASASNCSGTGKKAEVDLAKFAIDGSEPPLQDKKKAYDDALAAIASDTDSNGNPTAAATAAAELKTSEATTASERQAAQEKTEEADSQKRTLDAEQHEHDNSDTAQDITAAEQTITNIQTGVGLLSAAITLVGTIKGIFDKSKEEIDFAKAVARYETIAPQIGHHASQNFSYRTKPIAPHHNLGSKGGSITVFGGKRAFVRSPLVVISGGKEVADDETLNATILAKSAPGTTDGEGAVIVVAEKSAMLLSEDKAEVSAVEKTTISSQKELELTVQKAPTLVAPIPGGARDDATFTLTAKVDGTLTSKASKSTTIEVDESAKKGKLTLKTEAEQLLELDQEAKKVVLKSHETLEAEASKKMTFTVDTTEVAMSTTSIDAKAEGGTTTLKLQKTSAELGDTDAKLTLNPAKPLVQLQVARDKRLLINNTRTQLAGKKVQIKGSSSMNLDGGTGNITVKGSKILLG
jgi:type VI secretion system secreted protein VgrG